MVLFRALLRRYRGVTGFGRAGSQNFLEPDANRGTHRVDLNQRQVASHAGRDVGGAAESGPEG